jgi:zinc transport system permease protein
LTLVSIHPQLAASRGIQPSVMQMLFTVAIAVVVTLAISWVGLLILNSLLILPGASARNISRNLKQYHMLSVLLALIAGIGGLCVSYWFGTSAGASISLLLALCFTVSFCFRKVGA